MQRVVQLHTSSLDAEKHALKDAGWWAPADVTGATPRFVPGGRSSTVSAGTLISLAAGEELGKCTAAGSRQGANAGSFFLRPNTAPIKARSPRLHRQTRPCDDSHRARSCCSPSPRNYQPGIARRGRLPSTDPVLTPGCAPRPRHERCSPQLGSVCLRESPRCRTAVNIPLDGRGIQLTR